MQSASSPTPRPPSQQRNVEPWREPPRIVVDVLDAPPTPWVSLSPDSKWILFVEHAAMPSLADVARPMLRLAGVRIDPATDARHQTVFGLGLVLRDLAGRSERRIELPAGRRISSVRWSHASQRIACLLVGETGTSLWTADIASARLELVADRVNATISDGYDWMPDGERLLVARVPRGRGPSPIDQALPRGPTVLEAAGDTTPLRTYQDLLANERDEQAFEHHARSDLWLCDPRDGAQTLLVESRMLWEFEASPDGEWLLLTAI